MGETHAHTGEYQLDEYDTTAEMTSEKNDIIVDKDDNQSEVETDQNHTYVEILSFGQENAPDPYSTNYWEGFLGENEFDEIAANADHAKSWKGISVEHLSNVWHIDLESAQNTMIIKINIGLMKDNNKLTSDFGTGDRMLRYKSISEFFFMYTLFATKKSGK